MHFAEMKHNKSIVEVDLDLDLARLSMNDLSWFLQNNEALQKLLFGTSIVRTTCSFIKSH
jgi:hypothetical protein